MRLLGYNVSITKANPSQALPAGPMLPPITNNGWFDGWFNTIRESFPGAWQRNVEVRLDNVLTFSTVYACVSLIASDIGKVDLNLVKEDADGIWSEVDSPAFSPLLDKPNRYQTMQKFLEQWITSKLIYGNTYVLKERDARNVVVAMYVLDPTRCRPLIAPDGQVYYQLGANLLAGIEEANASGVDQTEVTMGRLNFVVPASEIIHDVMVPLYHPLCGVSPITACGLAAVQGIAIQNNSALFFQNGSRPGGILTAPGPIPDDTARRLKDRWEQNYSGVNSGKIAVLGDGLKYEAMTVTAVDAQLVNQLKWTSETVCSTFHVPPYMVGVGPPPAYNNIEALNQQYYSQCLQCLMEAIEELIDQGVGLQAAGYGSEFDLDCLLKMDTATQYETYGNGIKSGLVAPNEARKKINLKPLDGGDTVYLQQQNYSIEALNERDSNKPFAKPAPALPPPKPTGQEPAGATAPSKSTGLVNVMIPGQELHSTEWLAALKQVGAHARTY